MIGGNIVIKVNYDKETGKVIGFNKDIEPYIEITEEERRQSLGNKYGYYAVVDNKFVVLYREPTEEEIRQDVIKEKQTRIKEIEKWFSNNDWMFNKIFLGEWEETDERWLNYLTQRNVLRQEHEDLQTSLKLWSEKW